MKKKVLTFIVLLVFMTLNCQCRHDEDARLAAYLEGNDPQMEMLRSWCIDYHPERGCWDCRHWYNRDSLLAYVSVHVGKRNNVLSCEVLQLFEDSAMAVQTALQNINALNDIKCIYNSKSIDADEVYNDTVDYVIYMGNDTTLCQVQHAKKTYTSTDKHLYGGWYIRKNLDPNMRLAAYLEENESQLELLRDWSILYVWDRECWWCRHYSSRDSLLSFVLVRVDKHDRIASCEVNPLYEDSIVAVQTAKQNVSTLYDIKHIYGYKFMGADEVELFRDSFEYNFSIGMGDENRHLIIMLKNSENDTTDLHLYKKWYLRES